MDSPSFLNSPFGARPAYGSEDAVHTQQNEICADKKADRKQRNRRTKNHQTAKHNPDHIDSQSQIVVKLPRHDSNVIQMRQTGYAMGNKPNGSSSTKIHFPALGYTASINPAIMLKMPEIKQIVGPKPV